ncbi:hypothetical protein KSF_001300 [Reticulibacter mediterranei]|uniref:Uncharacterized protein n=1 Tax=Reticulibacter mediterranei TaxID=2778369 RepID=A0A8J3MXQ6_9CHLR|nr:hypothetical protein [Reticulibacter mediterranei]GHO90082.1 hypothetical protein KSF_001300 [Reticulibacter mediterranei]
MPRSSSHRFASLLTVISCALLVIGSFLPFYITTFHGHVTSGASLAGSFSSGIQNPFINHTATIPTTPDDRAELIRFNIMILAISLAALSSLLLPPIAALTSLFSRRLVFPILGLIFASLGLPTFGLMSLAAYGLTGFGPYSGTDSVQYDFPVNTPGPGFWLAGGGFTLTFTCFIVLIVLSVKKAKER